MLYLALLQANHIDILFSTFSRNSAYVFFQNLPFD